MAARAAASRAPACELPALGPALSRRGRPRRGRRTGGAGAAPRRRGCTAAWRRSTLLSAEIVRRQVSVDFALPAALRRALRVGEGQCGRRRSRCCASRSCATSTCANEAEEAVPVLARDHTTLLVGAALLAQASDAVARPRRRSSPGGCSRSCARPTRSTRPRAAGGAGGRRGARRRRCAALLAHEPTAAAAGRARRELPAARRAGRHRPPADRQVPLRLLPRRAAGLAASPWGSTRS